MAAPQPKTQNITLGSGYVRFNKTNASGNPTGFRYVGDTPGFTLNVDTEQLEVKDSDGPVAENIINHTVDIKRVGTLTIRDLENDNLAAFIMGEKETVTQTATPVVDESVTDVQLDREYLLGRSTSNPTGIRGLGSVVVTSDPAGTTYTEGTDYEVDADEALLYIKSGGGISAGDDLLVDYTPTANSRTRIKSNDDGAHTGEFLYIADNTEGDNNRVLIKQCELAANGDLAFKSRDDVSEMVFDINIQSATGYEQVYVDGEPVL